MAGLQAALEQAKQNSRPTLISVHTTIGYGSSKQGTAKTHGEALGAEDIKGVKKRFGFAQEDSFVVPESVNKSVNKLREAAHTCVEGRSNVISTERIADMW